VALKLLPGDAARLGRLRVANADLAEGVEDASDAPEVRRATAGARLAHGVAVRVQEGADLTAHLLRVSAASNLGRRLLQCVLLLRLLGLAIGLREGHELVDLGLALLGASLALVRAGDGVAEASAIVGRLVALKLLPGDAARLGRLRVANADLAEGVEDASDAPEVRRATAGARLAHGVAVRVQEGADLTAHLLRVSADPGHGRRLERHSLPQLQDAHAVVVLTIRACAAFAREALQRVVAAQRVGAQDETDRAQHPARHRLFDGIGDKVK